MPPSRKVCNADGNNCKWTTVNTTQGFRGAESGRNKMVYRGTNYGREVDTAMVPVNGWQGFKGRQRAGTRRRKNKNRRTRRN